MRLALPWPPSVNHYWRSIPMRGRGSRVIISREGRAFRKEVCALLACPSGIIGNGPRKPPTGGRIALSMDAFPPDRRRRDLDNLAKPVLDALEHAGIYKDDSQIDLLVTRRRGVIKQGRLAVRIDPFPLQHCPVCGSPVEEEFNA